MTLEEAFQRVCARRGQVGFDALTEPEKVLVTLWALEAEVNNGGFDQFFFNSSGDCAYFAPRALQILGATEMSEIAARANAVFGPDGPPREWNARQEALFALSDSAQTLLEALDVAFFAYPEDLAQLVARYVRANYLPS